MDIEGILNELAVSQNHIRDTVGRIRLNETVSDYFSILYNEYGETTYLAQSQRVHDCSKVWCCDYFSYANVYDVTYISHCRSRFCLNCQKLLQASRLSKFSPVLIAAAKDYDLYHIVLTVPNVKAPYLKATVQLMSLAFKRLILFLSGRKKIRGLDFTGYGFYGALRALEVTVNNTRDDYHPHYHCIFAFRKGLNLKKHITNAFSYDTEYEPFTNSYRKVFKRTFSDFEILLQKLWRCLIDSERDKIYRYVAVTDALGKPLPKSHPLYGKFKSKKAKKNSKDGAVTLAVVNALKSGYSVIMDFIEDDDKLNFYEVFKYAFKITTDEQQLFTYDQFKTMYFALYGVHVLQGYGAFYNLKPDELDESVNEFYAVLIAYLKQTERPVSLQLPISEVLHISENNRGTFITKAAVQAELNRLSESELTELKSIAPPPTDDYNLFSKRKLHITDISVSYYRYLELVRTSPLFANIRERKATTAAIEAAEPLLRLTNEQLNFLDSIF